MSKTSGLRTMKQERHADVAAYLAAVRPDLRISNKVRRVLKRRMMMKKELSRP